MLVSRSQHLVLFGLVVVLGGIWVRGCHRPLASRMPPPPVIESGEDGENRPRNPDE